MVRKEFIFETVDLDKIVKISKTQKGIAAAHAYLVVDVLEHKGYKYIVIKNPYGMKIKFNYKKSTKIPKEVELPEQAPEKTEAMMELSHFYKKIAALDYDVNAKKLLEKPPEEIIFCNIL